MTNAEAPRHIGTLIAEARNAGNRERSKALYYEALADPTISDNETHRMSFRAGVIDEGDRWLADNEPHSVPQPIMGGAPKPNEEPRSITIIDQRGWVITRSTKTIFGGRDVE